MDAVNPEQRPPALTHLRQDGSAQMVDVSTKAETTREATATATVRTTSEVLGLLDANSTEMDALTPNPVIAMMEEQKKITNKGGTMRLGSYPCVIKENTLAYSIYGTTDINERHRHRWEFNNKYLKEFENAGMIASGVNPQTGLVEIMEIPNHPFFIGVQYHPELKSTVENPQPLFVHFIKAAKYFKEANINNDVNAINEMSN